jgi:hypothetical protein
MAMNAPGTWISNATEIFLTIPNRGIPNSLVLPKMFGL